MEIETRRERDTNQLSLAQSNEWWCCWVGYGMSEMGAGMVGYLNASLAGGILESGRASAGICRHMPQNSMSTGDLLFIGSESGELRRCAFSLGFRRKYLLPVTPAAKEQKKSNKSIKTKDLLETLLLLSV